MEYGNRNVWIFTDFKSDQASSQSICRHLLVSLILYCYCKTFMIWSLRVPMIRLSII